MDINSLFPIVSLTTEQCSNLMPLFILSFGAVVTLLLGTHKTKGHFYASAGAFVFVTNFLRSFIVLPRICKDRINSRCKDLAYALTRQA